MFFVSSSYWIHEASPEKSSQMISKKNISAPNLSAWTKKGKIKWPTSLTCSINLSETPRIEKLYLTSCLIVISLKQSFNDNKTWRRKSEMLNQMSSWWSRVSSSWSSYVRLSVYPCYCPKKTLTLNDLTVFFNSGFPGNRLMLVI